MNNVQCSMYNVQSTMFNVHCTWYNVQCTLYTVQSTMFNAHCTKYNVQCTRYNVHCTKYNVQCTMYKVQCSLYNVTRCQQVFETVPVFCTETPPFGRSFGPIMWGRGDCTVDTTALLVRTQICVYSLIYYYSQLQRARTQQLWSKTEALKLAAAERVNRGGTVYF